mgnify:CR=1 FL=1
MTETTQDTAQETEEERNTRLDAEYERDRVRLSPEDREWLDSVVGMFDGDTELDVNDYRHEDARQKWGTVT